MKTPEYAPWEQVPAHLEYYKLFQYPYEPLNEYFESATPVRHLQYLRNWRHFSLRKEFMCHKASGPGKLVEIYLINIKLMEILYLLTGERMYYRTLNVAESYERVHLSEEMQNEARQWL